jgi:urease accessory protein
VKVRFGRRGAAPVVKVLYQQGSAKVRFPKVFDGGPPEAVLINLAGGATGGDCFRQSIHLDEGAHALVTTQAAEKIYRASAGSTPAGITNSVSVAADGMAEWLPQETIFFDGGRLRRRFGAVLHPTARLLACEAMIFGRTAMGETVGTGYLDDSWRVTVGDRMVFADGIGIDGVIQERLDRPAVAGGGRALATVLYVGPDSHIVIDAARQMLDPFRTAGRRAAASRIGDLIVARFVASDGAELRPMMLDYLTTIRLAVGRPGTTGGGLPKVWRC